MKLISIAIFTISMAAAVAYADSTSGKDDIFRSDEQHIISNQGVSRGPRLYRRSVLEKRTKPTKDQQRKEDIAKAIAEFTERLMAHEASAPPPAQPTYYYVNNSPIMPAPPSYDPCFNSGGGLVCSPPPSAYGCIGSYCPPFIPPGSDYPPEFDYPPLASQALLPPTYAPGYYSYSASPQPEFTRKGTTTTKKKEESEENEKSDRREERGQDAQEQKDEEQKAKQEAKEDQDEPEDKEGTDNEESESSGGEEA